MIEIMRLNVEHLQSQTDRGRWRSIEQTSLFRYSRNAYFCKVFFMHASHHNAQSLLGHWQLASIQNNKLHQSFVLFLDRTQPHQKRLKAARRLLRENSRVIDLMVCEALSSINTPVGWSQEIPEDAAHFTPLHPALRGKALRHLHEQSHSHGLELLSAFKWLAFCAQPDDMAIIYNTYATLCDESLTREATHVLYQVMCALWNSDPDTIAQDIHLRHLLHHVILIAQPDDTRELLKIFTTSNAIPWYDSLILHGYESATNPHVQLACFLSLSQRHPWQTTQRIEEIQNNPRFHNYEYNYLWTEIGVLNASFDEFQAESQTQAQAISAHQRNNDPHLNPYTPAPYRQSFRGKLDTPLLHLFLSQTPELSKESLNTIINNLYHTTIPQEFFPLIKWLLQHHHIEEYTHQIWMLNHMAITINKDVYETKQTTTEQFYWINFIMTHLMNLNPLSQLDAPSKLPIANVLSHETAILENAIFASKQYPQLWQHLYNKTFSPQQLAFLIEVLIDPTFEDEFKAYITHEKINELQQLHDSSTDPFLITALRKVLKEGRNTLNNQ